MTALIEKGPIVQSTLYLDDSVIALQTETVTLPMVGSDLTGVTLDDFARMVASGREAAESSSNRKTIGEEPFSKGLNVIFNVSNSPGVQADTALARAATYIESVFEDPITVTINVNFASLPPGVLGWTSVNYAGYVSWSNTRDGLMNGMDENDIIQAYLPPGTTIPVRYTGTSSVTEENRCRFSRANYNAVIGTQSGTAASMEFNTDFSWDYDPSNGVSRYCFQSVAIHEVGHALGFTSRAENWYQPNSDIDALDIFRFQETDGSGDYNPDDYSEFQTTPRLIDYNNPEDDHSSDIISAEYRMSDGSPHQASHFRTSVSALMDPNLASGETFYPDFYRIPDKDMFDAIGWDNTEITPNEPPYVPSSPTPDDSATGVGLDATLNWEGGDPDSGDTVTYDVYFGTASDPPLVEEGWTDTSFDPGGLDYGTEYFWRVDAKDNHGASASSPVWIFTTFANSPPYTPSTPFPEDSATDVSIDTVLSWKGGDPDSGDTVIYDIYFGVDSIPPLAVENWTDTVYNPGTFNYGTEYRWQILARDSHGDSAVAPVWSFVTFAFACGDCNGDEAVTTADGSYIVGFIYRGGPAPLGFADVNSDGNVTIADAAYIVSYIYRGGPPPCQLTRFPRDEGKRD